ncbi:uncharacterized protein LOC128181535 isoform X1 [Crassostrea angulata]|uniref:uncharacterized protein LOC128181535 isoform X1 n=1 Tax=Magallana angulata TaxID=2784310 RepID=UPI0022B0C5C4|nr:uncharacterized protein LOC128181535 isoform X1 [Crassostrea angulata]
MCPAVNYNVSKLFDRISLRILTFLAVLLMYNIGFVMNICQPPTKDFLHFTKNITDLDHVRARQFVYLDCCASGYDTITWYFKNNNTKYSLKEFPFLYQECEHNDECPTLFSENQTLLILKATVGYDNGSYICVAHNSSTGQNISHLEDLLVSDCVERPKPEPIPPSDVITNIGQNATFHCAADFGCKSFYTRDVSWYIGIVEVQDVSTRYIVTKENRDYNPVVQANLTVLNVQQSDFDVTFSCWVSSDSDIDTPKFSVKLRQEVINVMNIKVILIILPCVVFILFIAGTTKAVHSVYGPHVNFYCKSRGLLGGLPKMSNNHRYHALVVHDDSRNEDNDIADHITSTLEREGYKICNRIEGFGRGVFSHFGGYLEQSASVIILDMESDSDDSNTFRVFIESSLRNMADSLVGFTVIQRKGIENSMMDSVEYKGLKRLQWPGSESSDRRRQKFYKQLQLRLPKPVKLDERTPLLQNV